MACPLLCPAFRAGIFSPRQTHRSRSIRRGVSSFDVLVGSAVLLVAAAFLFPMLKFQQAHTNRFQNTCRNNLSNIAKSLFTYQMRNAGRLPGYINALTRKDGSLYVDPLNGKPTPVSWAVEILPDIDRQSIYEQYQRVDASPTVYPDGSTVWPHQLYIDLFICPNDSVAPKTGTPLSYVVNTGLPDAQLSATSPEIPRDWQSNGVLLDRYSDDPRVTPDASRRPKQVVTRPERFTRPKDKIILLTENVDAGEYVVNADRDSTDDWRRTEILLGVTWSGDVVAADGTLRRRPGPGALHPNQRVGEGTGADYAFARPSSRHPGGFNVAYVGQNVQFLRDTIDYYVYAKLLTTSDDGLMRPGTREPMEKLGDVRLTDTMINP